VALQIVSLEKLAKAQDSRAKMVEMLLRGGLERARGPVTA